MRRDDAYLLDMLVAARKAVAFARRNSPIQNSHEVIRRNAILRVPEIVGEAASRISEDLKTAHREFLGHQIIGLRDRIVHAYFERDLGVVWQVVEDLPALIPRGGVLWKS